ncbi:MAG TPA: ankyrin repeat domain-containing protein [Burkholderiaceae bacterium]|nr:ankyrin repeat domain-containing protein [Burkholderiaceae bacterium]
MLGQVSGLSQGGLAASLNNLALSDGSAALHERLRRADIPIRDEHRLHELTNADARAQVDALIDWWMDMRREDPRLSFDAALDFLFTSGAHRRAFEGAASLIELDALDKRPAHWDDNPHEHWVHYLAHCGDDGFALEEQGDAHQRIELKDRFQQLARIGLALDPPHEDLSRLPMFAAVTSNNIDAVKALADLGVRLSPQGAEGLTPLHFVTQRRQSPMLSALLECGANADAAMANGQTALHIAADSGDLASIKLLLKHGANPNACMQDDSTPMHRAIYHGHVDVLTTLLDNQANIDAVDLQRMTPLGYALLIGRHETISCLLERGADVNRPLSFGKTALHLAMATELQAFVEPILKRGAQVNVEDEQGNTPLHAAVLEDNALATRLLLLHGARPGCANALGNTPLKLARDWASSEVLGLLNAHAAD